MRAFLERRRYELLLLAIVLFVVLWPAVAPYAEGFRWGRTVLLTGLLAASLFVVEPGRMRRSVFVVVGALLVVGWAAQFSESTGLHVARYVIGALFHVLMVTVVLRFVLASGRVTGERVVAALCAYLILGSVWAELYGLIQAIDPPAFRVPEGTEMSDTTLTYVSFVTLTTLGFGDVTPVHPLARSLAFIQAAAGQIYLAVLVARLVALQIAHASKD